MRTTRLARCRLCSPILTSTLLGVPLLLRLLLLLVLLLVLLLLLHAVALVRVTVVLVTIPSLLHVAAAATLQGGCGGGEVREGRFDKPVH